VAYGVLSGSTGVLARPALHDGSPQPDSPGTRHDRREVDTPKPLHCYGFHLCCPASDGCVPPARSL
jgi:hypothetical protein